MQTYKKLKRSYVVISSDRCSAIKKTQDKTRVTLISNIAVHYTMLSNSLFNEVFNIYFLNVI